MFSYDFDENYAEVPIDWRENWKTHSWLLPHHHRVGVSFYHSSLYFRNVKNFRSSLDWFKITGLWQSLAGSSG